jgi:AcrR family transcriptional regulator
MVKRQDIIDAAFILFAHKGFCETTTENIAGVLGLKKQSLYSHFKCKNEILLEVLRCQSVIISKEINETIYALYGQPAETLLKGIYKCIIQIFSNRERLLLWKRLILLNDDAKYHTYFTDWQFEKKLRNELYKILCEQNPKLSLKIFRTFFLSYVIVINGFLDLLLIKGYDDTACNVVWSNYWNGAKNYFRSTS